MTFPRARIAARVAFRFAREHRVIFAMSLEEAKEALGFKPNENPSEADIQKAWKQMVFMYHPDRGGDVEIMKEVNVARDVLLGKQRATYSPSSSPSYSPSPTPTDYAPYGGGSTRARPPKVVITFDQAKSGASIPSGVTWKLQTQTSYGGYSGDSSDFHTAGFVLYGQTDSKHVFVSVYHASKEGLYEPSEYDKWYITVEQKPMGTPVGRLLPAMLKTLHSQFPDVRKGFSGKVYILPEGTIFNEKIAYSTIHGTAVNLKDALELAGLVATPEGGPAAVPGRKLSVVMTLGRGTYWDRDIDEKDRYYSVTLTVNGRPYELSPESCKVLGRLNGKFLRLVFGTYYSQDSKKDLTRAKDGKKLLDSMATGLTHEPQALRDLLAAAAAQMKK
jgi:hypothetical protein